MTIIQKKNNPLISNLISLENAAAIFFQGRHNPVVIDLEYKKSPIAVGAAGYQQQNDGLPDHPFGAIYHPQSQLWAEKNLAAITLRAAELLYDKHGWCLKIMDCLRPIEAQQAMVAIAESNGWSSDYVSRPGFGPHPRAMAIDLVPIEAITSNEIDMGSPFDHFSSRSHRNFSGLTPAQQQNRDLLNTAMQQAAEEKNMGNDLELLASEWWDFRFTAAYWQNHPAISEMDLPTAMKMLA
ncbi:MAG: M15 family metallopeptidase [Alphaproteobacteria bacterium]